MFRNTVRVGLLAAFLVAVPAAPAVADAQGNASCVGFEASSISPPGSLEEFPGGMPALQEFLRENVGTPTGGFVSDFAQLHEGSHQACDEAAE